jgi:three-Cys-motif partner protein
MTPQARDPHEDYWQDYGGLKHAKHQMLGKYLDRWYPILASWRGRILYVDCHAGRGRYGTGHEGSPILAIRRLLNHASRDAILANTEVLFIFFEKDEANYQRLQAEIHHLGPLPSAIKWDAFQDDYQARLQEVIANLRREDTRPIPTFAFVDPFGFKLSMEFLNQLLTFSQCEILINFMYMGVDKAIHDTVERPSQAKYDNLDELFGTRDWESLTKGNKPDPKERARAAVKLFADHLQAGFVSHMYMKAKNNVLKYALLHATNHPRGREVMKEVLWSITPDGSFTAVEKNRPEQLVLVTPEPDLDPLKDRLWECFAGQEVYVEDLYKWLVGELYCKRHLHAVLNDYHERGVVEFIGARAYTQNPLLRFPKERPPRYDQLRFC